MSFLAGSILRTTVTFTPEEDVVIDVGDVTATAIDAEGAETTLTVDDGAGDNEFEASFTVPDAAISGPWTVRWESADPKIVVETSFAVAASALLTP